MANLGGVGLAVSDMATSVAFYRDILGYVPTQTFDVQDFTETILAFPHATSAANSLTGGSQLILMQYKKKPAPKRQIGKLVWYVEEPKIKEIADKCEKKYGLKAYKKLGVGEGWIKDIHMVYDPDGFLIEFLPLRLQNAGLGDKAKI
jgi:catechol 2,3-dioxygenase-like lactoylglutathione lyase family enzyme